MKTREASIEREAARAILECLPAWRFLEPERQERLLARYTERLAAQRAEREGRAK